MMTCHSTENLCDVCDSKNSFPQCLPVDDVEFGDGHGNDNVVFCCNYPQAVRSTPTEHKE